MPKATREKQRLANGAKRPKKKETQPLTEEEKLQRLWRSAHDQLYGQAGRVFPQNALKSVNKILSLESDDFAFLAKIQLLAGLDQYKEAHELLLSNSKGPDQHPLEHAYLLYKLKREKEALAVIEKMRGSAITLSDVTARGLRVLEAQIRYRLDDFQEAQTIYEELLDGVHADHPEYADLQTNLAACQAYTDFFASIPSRLAGMSDTLPSVAQLEAAPLSVVVASHPSGKPMASRSNPRPAFTSALEASKKPKKKKVQPTKEPRPPKLPAHIAALPPERRPPPDPERWLPKSERSNWAAKQQAEMEAREQRRAEKRKKAQHATQGAAEPSSAPAPTSSSAAKGKKKARK